MLLSESVQVRRSFPAVRERLGALDDVWFEETLTAALGCATSYRATGYPERSWPEIGAPMKLRVERASIGCSVVMALLEWEVEGSIVFPVLHGELEVGALSPTETQLELTMRYETARVPPGGQGVAYGAARAALRSFTARLAEAVESPI